jgi:hypothetical protein
MPTKHKTESCGLGKVSPRPKTVDTGPTNTQRPNLIVIYLASAMRGLKRSGKHFTFSGSSVHCPQSTTEGSLNGTDAACFSTGSDNELVVMT